MDPLGPLLGRTLVIVAHPDDECIAFGALLQRISEPIVVYCTDGAPHDPYFWKQRYGSRERYAELRKQEARRALQVVGISDAVFLADLPGAQGQLVDQYLFRAIPVVYGLLGDLIRTERPNALLTLAYEGGHPDHDTCNFLTSCLANEFSLSAYEAPLYFRESSIDAKMPTGMQRFIVDFGNEIDIVPTVTELQRKRTMCAEYPSQGDFLKSFDITREVIRPLASYDYSKPPHPGLLNYEAWRWSMNGTMVCAAFQEFDTSDTQVAQSS